MLMRALEKKMLRDLNELRGMVLAIALIIACGVSVFVLYLSALDSLEQTQESFYRQYHFAEAFTSPQRAPLSVAEGLRSIPGVHTVEPRVAAFANLDLEGYPEPVRAQLVSVPDDGQPVLNQLYFLEGGLPNGDGEAVVSDAFAAAHGLASGDDLRLVVNGRMRDVRISGVGVSPEFILQVGPGSIIPDFERFAILWMNRSALASAYDMQGAFNDVSLTLDGSRPLREVLDALDHELEPYGSQGAYGRSDQQSHFYVEEELRQLRGGAMGAPLIFLSVAAFLLNVVTHRLVRSQREQVAVLKAFGYSHLQVGFHYVTLVGSVVAVGLIAGIGFGVWLGSVVAEIYAEYYRFPFLEYVLELDVVLLTVAVGFSAGVIGAMHAVNTAVRLPPAEAMRPEPPALYHTSIIERIGLKRFFNQPTRIILRNLERHPIKSGLTIVGVALAVAVVVMSRLSFGSVDYLIDVQYRQAQRDDMSVTLVDPASRRAALEFEQISGVRHAETYRTVPVRLRARHREYLTTIRGIEPGGVLLRLLDTALDPVDPPSEGLLMNEELARRLDVRRGDTLIVQVLTGTRPERAVVMSGTVRQFVGMGAYMNLASLNRLLGDGEVFIGAALAVDEASRADVLERLKHSPRVAGVALRSSIINEFRDAIAENWLIMALFFTFFSGAIAFGVVYNSSRIALSERSRELASLRILGFTRGEISYILLGELALLVLAAIPIGLLLGYGFGIYLVSALETDLYRIPLVIQRSTYSFAAVVVIASAVVSGLIVRRRLNKLDLIKVLKTRE